MCVCVCVCVSGVIYHTGNNGVASAELPKVYRACSKIGYVKVDGLGETLLFTRTKSDKNWPIFEKSDF